MGITSQTIAPGARIVVRDAEWLVRRVDRTSTGSQAISVIGISELVRDKDAVFLDELEQPIKVLWQSVIPVLRFDWVKSPEWCKNISAHPAFLISFPSG